MFKLQRPISTQYIHTTYNIYIYVLRSAKYMNGQMQYIHRQRCLFPWCRSQTIPTEKIITTPPPLHPIMAKPALRASVRVYLRILTLPRVRSKARRNQNKSLNEKQRGQGEYIRTNYKRLRSCRRTSGYQGYPCQAHTPRT